MYSGIDKKTAKRCCKSQIFGHLEYISSYKVTKNFYNVALNLLWGFSVLKQGGLFRKFPSYILKCENGRVNSSEAVLF
ncbi:MAG: hypothetical protein CSA95_04975 [Bacteroidetes bacterium]|nr:MAG: hypothetical protein CSA95_04975 [Bacteroidota bacterium]